MSDPPTVICSDKDKQHATSTDLIQIYSPTVRFHTLFQATVVADKFTECCLSPHQLAFVNHLLTPDFTVLSGG